MARLAEKFVVYNLRETYHELGWYELKVVLNPRFFKNSHASDADLVDSSGRPMRLFVERWGRKMNFRFLVDEDVSEGVSTGRLVLRDERDGVHRGEFRFWVIK